MTEFLNPQDNQRPVFPAFPVPIYMGRVTDDEAFNQELIRAIEEIKASDPKGVEICKREYNTGYTSFFSKSQLYEEPIFAPVVEQILRHGQFFAESMGFNADSPPLEFNTLFATINYKDSHHELHRHRNSFISGTYYVFADKTSAKISFLDPKAGLRMHEPPGDRGQTPFNSLEFSIRPKSGSTIMFPSYLEHKVEVQQGDQPRVSMSFNLDFAPGRKNRQY